MHARRLFAGAVAFATLTAACNGAGQHRPTTTTRAHAAPTLTLDPAAARGTTMTRDPQATVVAASGGDDETAAFTAAIDAALRGAHRRPGGPDGNPQAVVYVPAGVHRILHLRFRDNVRLEVDAGAVLEQAGGRDAPGGKAKYLIDWDGDDAATPLRNVSLVGVGTHAGGVKQQADPVAPGWDISNSFTFDLDPQATDASDKVSAVGLLNVDGFLIENVFSIQNASQASPPVWPTSAKAVFVLRPRNDSPTSAPFSQPRNGKIVHHYNIGSPRGYGPNQIGAATDVSLSGVYSQGGTALRLETDATKNKPFGGEIRGLRADNIEGVDCNRAVAFAPHAQKNYDVHVATVIARGCSQGVIESDDEKLGAARRGGFFDSTVARVRVIAGADAQNPAHAGGGSNGAWVPGPSLAAFARDRKAAWQVAYTDAECTGVFTRKSDRIMLGGSMIGPTCVRA